MVTTKIKQLLSFVMAALMCFSLTPMTAFAAEDEKDTLSISGAVEGHVYNVYQMLTGNIDDSKLSTDSTQGTDGVVQRANRGANLNNDVTIPQFVEAIAGKTQGELGNIVYKYIVGSPVASLSKATPSVDVVPGYYLITDTMADGSSIADGDAFSRFMVTVAGNTTITPKKDAPELEKKIVNTNDSNKPIDNGKTNTAAIGDVVEYELTSNVPNMEGYGQYKYIIHDTLSLGLTLDPESVVFTIGNHTLVPQVDFNLDQNGQSFTIGIDNLKAISGIATGDVITVKYSATINDNASLGYDPNKNTAYLEYSNDPSHSGEGSPNPDNVTGVTPDSVVETYVTGLELFKFEMIDGQKFALEGAEFTLTGTNLNKVILNTNSVYTEDENGTWYKLNDGKYTEQAPTDSTANQYASVDVKYVLTTSIATTSASAEGSKIVATVDEAGRIYFYGLNAGEYTLEETVVPEGYNALQKIDFKINAAYNEKGEFVWSSNNDTISPNDEGIFTTEVENVTGSLLPSTGGVGTVVLYVIGAAIVLIAIVALVRRRTKSSK